MRLPSGRVNERSVARNKRKHIWRQRTLSSSLALRMLSSLAFSVMSRRASLLAEGVDMVA